MTRTEDGAHDWPLRSWGLAALGASCGLAIHWLTTSGPRTAAFEDPVRLALAAFCAIGGLAFAYTIERARIASSALFALIAGTIMAFVIYCNGSPSSNDGEPWRLVCAALTVAIAAPLFMAWRDGPGGRDISYVGAHNRAWTSVVLWFSSWAFTGIVWALAFLIAALFGLIGIRFLSGLLGKGWSGLMMTGAALGGAIGVLRDREQILGTLLRVVTTVLSVLAPVLGVGLIIFLIALPFTGLEPLWQATKSTTPILIGCVIGALILANAVIGNASDDEAKLPVARYSAMALGLAMLPLGIIASISTGLRIQQYGLTPDRLWAVVFAAIACAYGASYLYALLRQRMAWAPLVRIANMRMAIALCAIAFVLATPLISFGALSTRDQIARLADGRTPVATFDWRAVRYDFGPAGKAAIAELARTGKTAEIRTGATAALKSENRYDVEQQQQIATLDQRLTVIPDKTPVPEALRKAIGDWGSCNQGQRCVLFYKTGDAAAILVTKTNSTVLRATDGRWDRQYRPSSSPSDEQSERREQALKSGAVTIQPVTRRQAFIDGEPVGDAFE